MAGLYPVFTVRNTAGQFIGTYRAKNAYAAISRVLEEQAVTAQTFRKSQPMTVRREDFTAKVEG